MALENHWGLTRTPEGLLRVLNAISSPWLGGLMDTGNFSEDPYDKLKQIAAQTVYVQAKTYYGGGEWYTLDLDVPAHRPDFARRKLYWLRRVGIRGKRKIPYGRTQRNIAMLREAFRSLIRRIPCGQNYRQGLDATVMGLR
ncbi:MAG: hypothetical protein QM813_23230 [Verrucomicrobiota bacterium]